MILLQRLIITVRNPLVFVFLIKVMGAGIFEEQLNILMQNAVVTLERKHIIRFLIYDLFGYRLLAAHRIHRNHAPGNIQEFQQRPNSRDLTAFAIDFDLSQRQAAFSSPGTH
jgi:hypothetical protein